LYNGSDVVCHTSVIAISIDSVRFQPSTYKLCLIMGLNINYGRSFILAKEGLQGRQLVRPILERLGEQTKISSIRSSAEDSLRFDVKSITNIVGDLGSSRSREAENPFGFDFLSKSSNFARPVSQTIEILT